MVPAFLLTIVGDWDPIDGTVNKNTVPFILLVSGMSPK